MRRILACALLSGLAAVASPARAGRTEVIAGGGLIAPRHSEMRFAAELLGYDSRAFRNVGEGEIGVLRELRYWLSVGPLARVYYGKMDPPYGGVPAITTFGASVAARVEIDLFPRPRLFLWADPSVGVGSIGAEDHRTVGFWGLRGGIGIGSVRDATSVRFRFGYAVSPTFAKVTPIAGAFDYGGFVFQLDGVFRVAQ